MWNLNYTVIWSDFKEIIGQRFPDNEEVAEAYEGHVAGDLEEVKSEDFSERQYTSLVEVYEPIKDKKGTVVGVLEAYVPSESIFDEANAAFIPIATYTIMLAISIFFILWALLMRKLARR
jgi:hypothetical protein